MMSEAATAPPPKTKRKRKKVPPPSPPNKDKMMAHSFELELDCVGEVRKVLPYKATLDDQENDIVEIYVEVELRGDDSIRGLPYYAAFKKLVECSAKTTEGKDTSTLKVKKTYGAVDVFLNDGIHKTKVVLKNASVKKQPQSTVVMGDPKTKVGFVGFIPAEAVFPLIRMIERTIDVVTSPAQQSLPL